MSQFVELNCKFKKWEALDWGRFRSFFIFRTILINLDNISFIKLIERKKGRYKIVLFDKVLFSDDITPILKSRKSKGLVKTKKLS